MSVRARHVPHGGVSIGVHDEGWNHNNHYHDRMLNAVPRGCRRALDVGCGLGTYARRLATVADRVDAIDESDAVFRQARSLSAGTPNVCFIRAGFMEWEPAATYDFISMIAVLHHLPFDLALTKAKSLLNSGGVLAVLGIERPPSLLHEGARSLVALPLSAYYRVTRRAVEVGAPTLRPTMTFVEIQRGAREILAGAAIRRHALWRYSLLWTKPSTADRH